MPVFKDLDQILWLRKINNDAEEKNLGNNNKTSKFTSQ